MIFFLEKEPNNDDLDCLKKLALQEYRKIDKKIKIDDLKAKCIPPECNPMLVDYYYVYIKLEK